MLRFHPVKTAADEAAVLAIYQSNPDYFALTVQPAPTLAMVQEDAAARPAEVSKWDKHYGLLKVDDRPVGVLDRLNGYPEADIVYIGLLMLAKSEQGQGLGQRVIRGLRKQFKQQGFKRLRVAVVSANTGALTFWERLGFKPLGESQAQVGAAPQAVVILEQAL